MGEFRGIGVKCQGGLEKGLKSPYLRVMRSSVGGCTTSQGNKNGRGKQPAAQERERPAHKGFTAGAWVCVGVRGRWRDGCGGGVMHCPADPPDKRERLVWVC